MKFSTVATRWGCDHGATARHAFEEQAQLYKLTIVGFSFRLNIPTLVYRLMDLLFVNVVGKAILKKSVLIV